MVVPLRAPVEVLLVADPVPFLPDALEVRWEVEVPPFFAADLEAGFLALFAAAATPALQARAIIAATTAQVKIFFMDKTLV